MPDHTHLILMNKSVASVYPLNKIFTSYIYSLLRYWTYQNLASNQFKVFLAITWKEICQTWNLHWEAKNYKNFHFRLFLGKSNDEIFQKILNAIILHPNIGKNKFSPKIGVCQFLYIKMNHAKLCKKSRKKPQ